MATLNDDLSGRLKRVPCDLKDEFPEVSLDEIESEVGTVTCRLSDTAHFTELLPVLVHRAARDRLRHAV
jgi:hypothetical protein